jgi:hypothetical protein
MLRDDSLLELLAGKLGSVALLSVFQEYSWNRLRRLELVLEAVVRTVSECWASEEQGMCCPVEYQVAKLPWEGVDLFFQSWLLARPTLPVASIGRRITAGGRTIRLGRAEALSLGLPGWCLEVQWGQLDEFYVLEVGTWRPRTRAWASLLRVLLNFVASCRRRVLGF